MIGAGLNEVRNIDLAVLVGMVENADRDTQSELIGAPKDSQKIKKKTADHSHTHKCNLYGAQRVIVHGNFKEHQVVIGSKEVPY